MRRLLFLTLILTLGGCDTDYGFRSVPVGSDPTEPLTIKSNGQLVRSLFADALARAPGPVTVVVDGEDASVDVALDEEDVLVGVLDGVGDTFAARALLADAVLSGDEIDLPQKSDVDAAQFVDDAFLDYLGRPPTPYEREAFVAAWQANEAVGPATVVRALVASRAYQGL